MTKDNVDSAALEALEIVEDFIDSITNRAADSIGRDKCRNLLGALPILRQALQREVSGDVGKALTRLFGCAEFGALTDEDYDRIAEDEQTIRKTLQRHETQRKKLISYIGECDQQQAALETGIETLCDFALNHGFSTGHADTLEDLLNEILPQIHGALLACEDHQAEIERLRKENAELVDILRECLGHLTGGMDGKWSEEFDVIVEIRTALAKHEGKE